MLVVAVRASQNRVGTNRSWAVRIVRFCTNIAYANIKSNAAKKIGIIEMGIEVDNINRLKSVITKLQSIPEVISVKRIQGTSSNKSNSQPMPKKKK